MSSRKIQPNLDLIRATAVMSVFFGHLSVRFWGHTLTSWHFAQMGVLIFFVHTACVLMWSLERSGSMRPVALGVDFYVRRAFRIYPLAIGCVVLSWYGLSITRNGPFSATDLVSNLTLTMNLTRADVMWPGLWTLPIEIQMYVVLPFAFLFVRHRPIGFVLAFWGLAVIAGLLQPSSRLSLMEYSPCFLSGVLAWHLARRFEPRISGAWWPVAFVATWSLWFLAPQDGREWYRWTFCLALGALIPWFRDITWRPLVRVSGWIATYSYGIYLTHSTVFEFALGYEAPYVRWPLLVSLVILTPMLLFHLIEDPMIGAGRQLAERLRRYTLPAATPEPDREPALMSVGADLTAAPAVVEAAAERPVSL
jgi:peptidoglycan/LPS O-acetylase OafA/YrhL